MRCLRLISIIVLAFFLFSCAGTVRNIKRERLQVRSVTKLQINKAFPGAGELAAELRDMGFRFSEAKDWFGPESTPAWVITIGTEVDVYTAQAVISICSRYAKGNIIVIITDSERFGNRKRIYVGALSQLRPEQGIKGKKIKKLMRSGLTKEEFKTYAD